MRIPKPISSRRRQLAAALSVATLAVRECKIVGD